MESNNYIPPHLRTEAEKDALLFGKKLGTYITTGELPKKRKTMTYKESGEQSTIAGYIKKNYPNIPLETVKHEGKKSRGEQNRHSKQNTEDSFPDTRIYLPNITLMFENKKHGTKLTNNNNELTSWQLQYQYNTHKRLFNEHTRVYFIVGVDEAIEIFEMAVKGEFKPMQIFNNYHLYQKELDNSL